MAKQKFNIQCMSIKLETNDTREWEITADGKVWPCCKFVADLYPEAKMIEDDLSNATIQKKKIMDEIKNNPDWNNAFKKPMKDILSHPLYVDYISRMGWDSNNPPIPCQMYCNLNQTENRNAKHASRFNYDTKDND